MSEKYITLRSYHTEQFINSIELQKDKSSKRYGFRHGYDCGFKVAFEQIDTLTAKVKRYEEVIEAALRLQDLWLYTGKITVEHASEAQALNLMKRNFEAALNQGES